MVNKFKFQKFKKETSIKIFKIAESDLYAAEILSRAPALRPEIILYHIQQSIEKSLKSVIIHLEISVQLTHEIDLLIQQLPDHMTVAFPKGIGELTQYATIRRYTDGDELIEQKDIQITLECGQYFINWARQILF